MDKLSVRDLDLKGKKILVRVDFNVPIEKGKITDDTRIKASLPTLQYILDHGGSVICMSHLGRPKGKPEAEFSLAPCAKRLSVLLQKPVNIAPDCIGSEVEKMAQDLKPGEILLLENLRFHPGEEDLSKEPGFADGLAKLGDVYVNDAFGSSHRHHASVTSVPALFPGKAAAGLLMEKEIEYLGKHLLQPKRPFCAILGGSKISTKFKVIESLMITADTLVIGGAMANTFFKAEHISIGNSLYEPDFIGVARQILDLSEQSRALVLLPVDVVISKDATGRSEVRVVDVKEGIPEGFQTVDIGPKTVQLYSQHLQKAATVFWNGPLGIYEVPEFAKGTIEIAKSMSMLKAITIVGGGDSVAAIEEAKLADRFSHLSTGGGASLEYIEFGTLPGIESLS